MNSAVWESIRPEFESRYHVSWIDLPGHGNNQHITVNNSAHSMDKIVDYILPHIPNGAHLLGWSLGGLVIQAIAERLSKTDLEKIKSMTLVASTLRFSQTDSWPHAMSEDVLNTFSKNLNQDIEGTLKRFIALQFMGIKDSKPMQRELINTLEKWGGASTPLSRTVIPEALNTGLELLKHSDFRLASHKIPMHWILAERDRLIPKEVINDLKSLRPDDQITLLENAGHAPFMTHPKAFIESVVPFIKDHS
ncbi:MAG: alpha/beta fold hydrolase [Cocleimonas sp.]|nr:alpha/beta fold hydrolase [Cocleimonas sp.]